MLASGVCLSALPSAALLWLNPLRFDTAVSTLWSKILRELGDNLKTLF